MNPFFQHLRVRLTLLMMWLALPSAVVLVIITLTERETAIDHAFEHSISIANNLTVSQSKVIDNTKSFLAAIAKVPEITNSTSERCSDFLRGVMKYNDMYTNLVVPAADGELRCSALPIMTQVNLSDRPYIQQAISEKVFTVGQYQIDRLTGVPSTNFAYPVIGNSGDVKALVVAVISLDWWSQSLRELNLPEKSIVYMLDANSNILASLPANNPQLVNQIENTLGELSFYATEPNTKIVTTEDNEIRVFITRSLVAGEDQQSLSITVGIPITNELNVINTKTQLIAFFVAIFVIVILVIAYHEMDKSVLAPVRTLLGLIKSLHRGEAIPDIKPKGSIEFVELQKSFLEMANVRLSVEQQLKNSQYQLLKSEERLIQHIEHTPLACISWDKNLICTGWNKSAVNTFGYTEREALGKSALELIVPDEQKFAFQSQFMELFANKQSIYGLFQNISKAGRQLTCEWNSTAILDENGEVESITSLIQDSTEQKLMEEKLTLAASVFSNAREGIIIADASGVIRDVNKTFVHVTGYSREEAIGQTPAILRSGKHPDEFYKEMWDAISKKGYWFGEVWNKNKEGKIYPQLLNISAVYGGSGQIKSYVALFTDITKIKENEKKLEHIALYDVLTELPNRSLLSTKLDHALEHCKQYSKTLAVLFLDLDGFKSINDKHGHDVGDKVLVALSKRMQRELRGDDIIARYGGDEFVIVLSDLARLEDYIFVVERLLNAASEPVSIGPIIAKVSVSIGITFYPQDTVDDSGQMIRHADQAMYIAKQQGKNGYHIFDVSTEDAMKLRAANIQQIAQGLSRKEFVLHYQPKVNMKTGEVIGAEALIRWHHPVRGLLPPGSFLPEVENQNICMDIGEFVVTEALKQIDIWQQSGINLQVSVNVSALELQQIDFAEKLEQHLSRYPAVSSSLLQLEVLETSALGDLRNAA
ncbi:MAG: diguanylate cyclase, partial [Gammaproteobacteria bacterium]|nr:diguanylate cyclase [Gammaproteobacteria bacterium]